MLAQLLADALQADGVGALKNSMVRQRWSLKGWVAFERLRVVETDLVEPPCEQVYVLKMICTVDDHDETVSTYSRVPQIDADQLVDHFAVADIAWEILDAQPQRNADLHPKRATQPVVDSPHECHGAVLDAVAHRWRPPARGTN